MDRERSVNRAKGGGILKPVRGSEEEDEEDGPPFFSFGDDDDEGEDVKFNKLEDRIGGTRPLGRCCRLGGLRRRPPRPFAGTCAEVDDDVGGSRVQARSGL